MGRRRPIISITDTADMDMGDTGTVRISIITTAPGRTSERGPMRHPPPVYPGYVVMAPPPAYVAPQPVYAAPPAVIAPVPAYPVPAYPVPAYPQSNLSFFGRGFGFSISN